MTTPARPVLSIPLLTERLQALRHAQGLSIVRLAIKSGLAPSQVQTLCEGKSPKPGLTTVAKLATALGCSIDYLCGRDEKPPNPP